MLHTVNLTDGSGTDLQLFVSPYETGTMYNSKNVPVELFPLRYLLHTRVRSFVFLFISGHVVRCRPIGSRNTINIIPDL